MLHEVDKVVISASDRVKGYWAKGKVRAMIKTLNDSLAKGEVHLHFISGAEDFCTDETKVTIFVEAPEKLASEPQQEGEPASG